MENGQANCAMEAVEQTDEFRILMAYATRRKPQAKQNASDQTPQQKMLWMCEGHDRKRPGKKRCGKLKTMILSCVRPRTKEPEQKPPQCHEDEAEHVLFRSSRDNAERVADQLTKIADSVPPQVHADGDDIESDCPEDIIEKVVQLLRESGDKLNEEILKDKSLASQLQSCFNYSFFEKVTSLFLRGAHAADKEPVKIALAFEVTSRLTAVNSHPMNRVLGFGAKYLQENYSAWIQQHGGWDNAFDGEDDDEIQ